MWHQSSPCSRLLPKSPPPLRRDWRRHSSTSRWLEDEEGYSNWTHPMPPLLPAESPSSVCRRGSLGFSRDPFHHQSGTLVDPFEAPGYSRNAPGLVNVNLEPGCTATCDRSCRDPFLSTWNQDRQVSASDWLEGPSVGSMLDRVPEPSSLSRRRRSSSVLQFQYNANASMRLDNEPLSPVRPKDEYFMVRQLEANLASDHAMCHSHLANKLSDPLRLRDPLTERDPHQLNRLCERSFRRLGSLSLQNCDHMVMNSMNYIHPSEYFMNRAAGSLVPTPELDPSAPYGFHHTRLKPCLSESRPPALPSGPPPLQSILDGGESILGTSSPPRPRALPPSATPQQERCNSSVPLDLSRVTARDYLDPPAGPLSLPGRHSPGKTAEAGGLYRSWGSSTVARLESLDHHDTDSQGGPGSSERRNDSLSSSAAAQSCARRSCDENWDPWSSTISSSVNSSVRRTSGDILNLATPSASTSANSSMRRTSDENFNFRNPSISTAGTRRSCDENWDPWSRNENWDPWNSRREKRKVSGTLPLQTMEVLPSSTTSSEREAERFPRMTSESDTLESSRHSQSNASPKLMPSAQPRQGGSSADTACGKVPTRQHGSSTENTCDDSWPVTSASTEGLSTEVHAAGGSSAGSGLPWPAGTGNRGRLSEVSRSSQSPTSLAALPESVKVCTGTESSVSPPSLRTDRKDSPMSTDFSETEGQQKRSGKHSVEEVVSPDDKENGKSCTKRRKHSVSVSELKDLVSPSILEVMKSSPRLRQLARQKSVESDSNPTPTAVPATPTSFQSPYDLRRKGLSSATPETSKGHKVRKDKTSSGIRSLSVNLFPCKPADHATKSPFPYDLRNKSQGSSTPEGRKRHGSCLCCDNWDEAKSCSKNSKKKCQKSKTSSVSDPAEREGEPETPGKVCQQEDMEVEDQSVDSHKAPISDASCHSNSLTPKPGTHEERSLDMQSASEPEGAYSTSADVADESRDGTCVEAGKVSQEGQSPEVSPGSSLHSTKQDSSSMNSQPASHGAPVTGGKDSGNNSFTDMRNPFYTRYSMPAESPNIATYSSGDIARPGSSQFTNRSDPFRDAMFISYKDYQIGGHRPVLNRTGNSLVTEVQPQQSQTWSGSAKMRELAKIVQMQKLAKLASMQKLSVSAHRQNAAGPGQIQGRTPQPGAGLSGQVSAGVCQAPGAASEDPQSSDTEDSDDWDEDQPGAEKLFIDEGNLATSANNAASPPAASNEDSFMETGESAADGEGCVVQSPAPRSKTSINLKGTSDNLMSDKEVEEEKTAEEEEEERLLRKRVPLLLSSIKAIKSLQPVVSMVRVSPEDMKLLNIQDSGSSKAAKGGSGSPKAKTSSLKKKQPSLCPSSQTSGPAQTNGPARESSPATSGSKESTPHSASPNWIIARPRQKRKVDYDIVDTSEKSLYLCNSDEVPVKNVASADLPDVIIPRKEGKPAEKGRQPGEPCETVALPSRADMDHEISQLAQGGRQLASQLGENMPTSVSSGESYLTVNTGSAGATILVPMPPLFKKKGGRKKSKKAPLRSSDLTVARSPGTGQYMCVYCCDFRCDGKLDLANHIKEHRFRCGKCQLVMPDKATLQLHRLQQHLSELHFCPLCSKHFLSAGFYKNHIKGAQHQMLLRVQQATLNTVIYLGQQVANSSAPQPASSQGGDSTASQPQVAEKASGGVAGVASTEDSAVDNQDLTFDIDLLDMDLLSIDLTNSPSPHPQPASAATASSSSTQCPPKAGEMSDACDGARNLQADETKYEQTEDMQYQQCGNGLCTQPGNGQFEQSSEGLYAQSSDGSHPQTSCVPYQQSQSGSYQQSSDQSSEQPSGAVYPQSFDTLLYRQSMDMLYHQSGDPSFQDTYNQQYQESSQQQHNQAATMPYQQPVDSQYSWESSGSTSQSVDAGSCYGGPSNMMAPPQNPASSHQQSLQSSSDCQTYNLGSQPSDFTATNSSQPSTSGFAGSADKFIPMAPGQDGLKAEGSFLGMLCDAPPPPQQLTPGAGMGGGPPLEGGSGQVTQEGRGNAEQEKDSADPQALKAKLDKLLMEIADDIYGEDSAMW